MKKLLFLAILFLTGCYSRVYFDTMEQAREAFPYDENLRVRTISDQHHQYYNKVEVRYKPF